MKAKSIAVILPVFCLGSCALFSGSDNTSLQRIDDLVSWVERVHVNAELAKDKYNKAYEQLQAIAAGKYGDGAVTAYQTLVQSIGQSERQAQTLRNSFASMQSVGKSVFERWSQDLMQFSSTRMRLRSQNRLLATRERYDTVVAAVGPAQQAFDALNKELRDHALYLGNDFNPASVAGIAEDVRQMTSSLMKLDQRMDQCLLAARQYVETSALPVTAAPNEAAPRPAPPRTVPPAPSGDHMPSRPQTQTKQPQPKPIRVQGQDRGAPPVPGRRDQ